jgi:hypothetical protein
MDELFRLQDEVELRRLIEVFEDNVCIQVRDSRGIFGEGVSLSAQILLILSSVSLKQMYNILLWYVAKYMKFQ